MTTRVVFVDNQFPEKDKIEEVVDVLRAGGIAGIPTETVFGLACNGNDKNAVKKLCGIKNRPFDKSLVIQIADINKLLDHQVRMTSEIKNILNRFWPGPLTVIVDTKYGKTGFRMPDNKATLSIIRKSDFPLVVTSANLSGEKDLFCAEDTKVVFGEKIDVVVDDGTKARGIASTVLDCTQIPFKILREGSIAEEIRQFLTIADEII